MALSESDKQVFLAAANRRKENGLRLKRISFMAESAQVEAFNLIWSEWVQRYGKQQAVDHLILLICRAEARYRDGEAAKERKNAD
jgi:hypothetical protein